MPMPAMSVTYGPGDFDPPDLTDPQDERPDSERDYRCLIATMPPERDAPAPLYGTRAYTPADTVGLAVVPW